VEAETAKAAVNQYKQDTFIYFYSTKMPNCKKCMKSLSSKEEKNLLPHVCKIFICPKCKKTFPRKFNLDRHLTNQKGCEEKGELFKEGGGGERGGFLRYLFFKQLKYPFPTTYLTQLFDITDTLLEDSVATGQQHQVFDTIWHGISILSLVDVPLFVSHLKEKGLDLTLIIKHMEEMRKGGITMFVEKNIEDLLMCVNHINNAFSASASSS